MNIKENSLDEFGRSLTQMRNRSEPKAELCRDEISQTGARHVRCSVDSRVKYVLQ